MKWLGRSFGLALVCVAATAPLCLGARGAEVERAPPSLSSTAIAAGNLAPQAPPADFGAAPLRGDADSISFQPELPPDDGDQLPAALVFPPAASGAGQLPRRDSPLAKWGRQTAPEPSAGIGDALAMLAAMWRGGVAAPPGAASPADVEKVIEAMLTERVAGKPTGARDWRNARIEIGAFYLLRGFSPAWTNADGFTAPARAAIDRIGRAGEDGLDLSMLSIPAMRGAPSAAELAEADVRLSEAIVAYAVQASGGRIDPRSISPEITAKPDVVDPINALTAVFAAGDPGAALENFNPPQNAYRELRDKLAELRAEQPNAAQALPAGPTLKIGMSDPRVPIIRARFGLDSFDEGRSNASVYDSQVAAAVADFQRANGLSASGLLTLATVEAMSGRRPSPHEAAVLANMEMWRWEPRDMGRERVEVNVPDFTLKLTEGDEVIHRARVIVGKPDTQTAIFSNKIKYLLINPAWNVPMSIIKKEMLPKLVKDPDYLTRAGFEVTQKGDMLIVRQPPGERNALGHILFMFPNEHSIYLHDTPARGLFGASRRAFSHGCVRVDDPMRLGEILMGGAERGWTQARLRSLVGDKERTIFLPRPIPIHIEYFTAFVDDSGSLQLRDDLYGHTRKVETALGLSIHG